MKVGVPDTPLLHADDNDSNTKTPLLDSINVLKPSSIGNESDGSQSQVAQGGVIFQRLSYKRISDVKSGMNKPPIGVDALSRVSQNYRFINLLNPKQGQHDG